jgi:dTDP-4-amino-4,6-dideoxygalactose transaminase
MQKRMLLKIPMGVPYWDHREIFCIFRQIFNRDIDIQEEITKLENKLCSIFGANYCITTDLARQAIVLALRAMGIKKGDGVILPSFVCQTIILPVLSLGCIPQFVDIGDDLNISPESVKRTITPLSRAIIMPHLYGKAAPADEVLEIARNHNLFVIDDAAQAMGAKYKGQYAGTMGDVGIFSFGPFKGIMATRGGALVTNNKEIFQKILNMPLAENKSNSFKRGIAALIKFKYRKFGYPLIKARRSLQNPTPTTKLNFSEMAPERISPMDAAIAQIQLDKLHEITKRKSFLGKPLTELLSNCKFLDIPPANNQDNVFVKFVIRLKDIKQTLPGKAGDNAASLIKYLRRCGIEAEHAYAPLHLKDQFASYYTQDLPYTEHICKNLIALPLNPDMSISDLEFMATCVKNFNPSKF